MSAFQNIPGEANGLKREIWETTTAKTRETATTTTTTAITTTAAIVTSTSSIA